MLMSGEMSEEKGRELTRKERFDVWMVNEGYRRLCVACSQQYENPANTDSFVFTFAILHIMVFVFGMMNYGLKVRTGCYGPPDCLALTHVLGQRHRYTSQVWNYFCHCSFSCARATR